MKVKGKKYVQIYSLICCYFEISVFEISRVDCMAVDWLGRKLAVTPVYYPPKLLERT